MNIHTFWYCITVYKTRFLDSVVLCTLALVTTKLLAVLRFRTLCSTWLESPVATSWFLSGPSLELHWLGKQCSKCYYRYEATRGATTLSPPLTRVAPEKMHALLYSMREVICRRRRRLNWYINTVCSVRLLFSALEATHHFSLYADFVLYRVLQQERNRVRTVHHKVSSAK